MADQHDFSSSARIAVQLSSLNDGNGNGGLVRSTSNSFTRVGGGGGVGVGGGGTSTTVAASDQYSASSSFSFTKKQTTNSPKRSGETPIINNNNNTMQTIDFIGSSTAVKHLFSLPYNDDRSMSMALHNLGNGTFLLDSGEEFGSVSTDSTPARSSASGSNTKNSSAACSSYIEGTIFRRGRRRQRPTSWSIASKSEGSEQNDTNTLLSAAPATSPAVDTSTTTTCELTPIHLARLREKEQVLLTSLTSLLEEEHGINIGEKKEATKPHLLLDNDKEAVVFVEENFIPTNYLGGDSPLRDEDYAVITPSPSNAIVVSSSNNNASLGGTMSEVEEPTVGSVIESNDPLGSVLRPPQHYISQYAGVSPPSEPRQYVHWNLHDMKLLVASDAIIFKQGGESGRNEELSKLDDKITGSSSSMMAIRIEDVSELKSQMLAIIESREKSRLFAEGNGRLSYAEALLLPSAKNETFEGDHRRRLLLQNDVGSAAENVEIVTSIVPSLGVDPQLPLEWAPRLGFTPSPFHPEQITSNGCSSEVSLASEVVHEGTKKTEAATTSSSSPASTSFPMSSTPICTVLDVYLDNLMANIPQLALILREHGFIQNIKLLRTEDIPTLLLHPSTLGGETSSTYQHEPLPQPVFSPDIVEMNAAMLLRFLKANCTRENSTYLLHRAAGEANIQLFDVSSISNMRQRKWVWWLALCSYRFACRLDQLRTNVLSPHDDMLQREYRRRQRSLLQNTLDLLEELADMDGGRRHDTIGAAVCEHLADTYLWSTDETGVENEKDTKGSSSGKSPLPCASSSQPYRKVTVDCLKKAHDHLMNGVNKITPLLVKARQDQSPIEIEALSTQLYGIYHKVVNVNLRLADRHLQNYFSSNLIQNLRLASRILSQALSLLDEFSHPQKHHNDQKVYVKSIILQYSWMWEYCGHYARSFASDGLWRDRGHTSGADIIGLLREVNISCGSIRKQCFGAAGWKPKTSIELSSHGQVSLSALSGIVILPKDFEQIEASVLQKEGCHEAISTAKAILDQKTQIKRDTLLVLVAASICFGYSIDSYFFLGSEFFGCDGTNNDTAERLKGVTSEGVNFFSSISGGTAAVSSLLRRLGDACNEVGKIVLHESREVLLPQFVPPGNISRISTTNFGLSHVSAIMLSSAKFWFVEGLEQFTQGKDARNTALLRCNLCQCCKLRANTNVILPGTSEGDSKRNNSEQNLQEAVDNLVLAHEALGQRDFDPGTWDMVNAELAATLLVLGVRRRQSLLSSSSEPLQFQALRLSPGEEKAIVEPMEQSCKIYESLGTEWAGHQAAAAHYQLALYFSKVWTCQRDETKTREKLSAAFMHYGLAHQYFFKHIRGNEITFVMLSLDFSNLYSSVSGDECLSKALLCCLDTRVAFSLPVAPRFMEQMIVLAENIEGRVSKLLLGLMKIVKENNKLNPDPGQSQRKDKYKEMYREALKRKVAAPSEKSQQILHVFELLLALNDLYN